MSDTPKAITPQPARFIDRLVGDRSQIIKPTACKAISPSLKRKREDEPQRRM